MNALIGRLALGPVLLAGCNLVSTDLTRVTVQLPIETYMVDTNDHSKVKLPPGVPAVACTSDANCCPSGCAGDGYTLACGGQTCQATVVATLVAPVDLSADPQVAQARSAADVSLRDIEYAVCDNTLTVAIPQIELWLAPTAVTRPDPSMGAKKLGTVPMVPAMQSVACPADRQNPDPKQFAKVALEPNAAATFASFAGDLKMRFNALAVCTLLVTAGDPTPTGAVTVLLSGTADAHLSL
jgi:hypothetical protein